MKWGECSSLRCGGRPSVIVEYVVGWAPDPVQFDMVQGKLRYADFTKFGTCSESLDTSCLERNVVSCSAGQINKLPGLPVLVHGPGNKTGREACQLVAEIQS
jgi:hypothetical protein